MATFGMAGAHHQSERESNGLLSGVSVGVITDNDDPDGLARVRVRLPWHAKGDTSYWARLATPMAGGDHGSYFVPDVGDEVLVAAETGDPSHLFVIGSLWNGKNLPPATNENGKNDERFIRSRAGHELRFVDDESAPEIDLKLADGKHLRLDKDGVVLDDGSGNSITITSSSGAIEIAAGQSLDFKAPKVSISADTSMEIQASGTLTLKGATVQIN